MIFVTSEMFFTTCRWLVVFDFSCLRSSRDRDRERSSRDRSSRDRSSREPSSRDRSRDRDRRRGSSERHQDGMNGKMDRRDDREAGEIWVSATAHKRKCYYGLYPPIYTHSHTHRAPQQLDPLPLNQLTIPSSNHFFSLLSCCLWFLPIIYHPAKKKEKRSTWACWVNIANSQPVLWMWNLVVYYLFGISNQSHLSLIQQLHFKFSTSFPDSS